MKTQHLNRALGQIIHDDHLADNLEINKTSPGAMPVTTKLGLLQLKDRFSAVGGGAKFHSLAAAARMEQENTHMQA